MEFVTLENQIITATAQSLLGAGYALQLEIPGGPTTPIKAPDEIVPELALYVIDHAWLHAAKPESGGHWVKFVFGNERDVISDYSTGLEHAIAPINDAISAIQD